ncbi:MAG: hypothetical protein LBI37_00360 [Puniceicoccales bacterium]|jgi:hypothetical protein|nr:hypothetical protein [Puniceicoccales bacterium]
MSDVTVRLHGYESISQFSVIIDNKIGSLNTLMQLFHTHDEPILAISMVDHEDLGIVRIVPSYPEEVRELLLAHCLNFVEKKLVGVELVSVSTIAEIVQAMANARININYIYPLLVQKNGFMAVVIGVDDPRIASIALSKIGLLVLGQNDLSR